MNAIALTLVLSLLRAEPITYKLSADLNVSAAVYDSTGAMVGPPILYGQAQPAGTQTIYWSGRDASGRPVAPGTYTYKVLATPGFSRELLVNVGVPNIGEPFGVWPGNHAGPTLVYCDADDGVYVASVSSEGPPHVIKLTPDGSRKLWDDGTWGNLVKVPDGGVTGLVASGHTLYLRSGSVLSTGDARTGNGGSIITSLPAGVSFPPLLSAVDPSSNTTLTVVGNTIQRTNSAGTVLTTYGGSRVYGPFNPSQFDTILSISCDSQGNFYVCEQFPRRVARFDSKGNLLNQWIGGFQWGSMAAFDPADPTTAYVPVDHLHWGRAKLDFANKSWELTDLYPPVNHSSWMVGKTGSRDVLAAAPDAGYFEVRTVAGQKFLLNRQGNWETGQSGVLVLRVDDEQLTPVAYLGSLHPTLDAETLPPWWLAAQGLPANTTFSHVGYTHFAFQWNDAGGNGVVDTSEISVASIGNVYDETRVWSVDDNWNLTAIVSGQIATIANEGTATAPKWNWNNWKFTPLESDNLTPQFRGCYSLAGSLYTVAVMPVATQDETQPYPNRTVSAARLLRFDATGKQMFAVGQHTLVKNPAAGTFAEVRAIVGQAAGNLVVMDSTYPGHATVWTPDGLYAGSFQGDAGYSQSGVWQPWQALAYGRQIMQYGANPTYMNSGLIGDDCHWGQVIDAPAGVYWGSMAPNSTPLYRITGFDGWVRLSGSITVE